MSREVNPPFSVCPDNQLYDATAIPRWRHHTKGQFMKKTLLAIATTAALTAGLAFAAPVRDWHDLEKVHAHVTESIHEMERARAANHYDMSGHGAKAEDLLRQAEKELHEAVEAAKAAK
jgi:hypothetical protein